MEVMTTGTQTIVDKKPYTASNNASKMANMQWKIQKVQKV